MNIARIGVIGAGRMGEYHTRLIYENPLSEFVCISDIDFDRAKSVAGRYKGKSYEDYQDMIEKEGSKLDGILVLTPEHLHLGPVERAAECGLDIFIEKPIAHTLDDADKIINITNKNDVRLMIGYNMRYDPNYLSIKYAFDGGTLGELRRAYARRNTLVREGARLHGRIPVSLYLLVHDCDFILWCVKKKIKEVYATSVAGALMEEYNVADFITAIAKFEDGSYANIECGWGLTDDMARWKNPPGWGATSDFRMDVIGSKGCVYVSSIPSTVMGFDEEGWKMTDFVVLPEIAGKLSGQYRDEIGDFVDVLLTDRPSPIPGEEARASLECAIAADISCETGKPVKLPL